jgi:hypothetical protein
LPTLDDLVELAWPYLSSEVSASGQGIALGPVRYSFTPTPPVVQATDPDWLVRVVRPPAMTIVEEITDSDDPAIMRTFDEEHEDQANDLGSFKFSTWKEDAWDIQCGDLVEFYDRGVCIGGGVILVKETIELSEEEEGKPLIIWQGVRPAGVLQQYAIRPARGLGSLAQDRIWGWFGITYDDSTWIPANEIAVVGSGYWWSFYDVVPDFEDRTARWVFARRRAGDPPMDRWAPGGECLFRQTGTIPAGVTEVEIEWAGDVMAELYFEGESIGTAFYGEGEGNVERRRVAVVPGSEVLVAVACSNDDWPTDPVHGPKSHNPGGAIWAVHWINSAGQRGGIVMHSDSSAVMLEYPTSRPGVTPGEVLLEIRDEAQSAGYVTWLAPTFTADVDSKGRPWAEVGEIGTKVGYPFWKFVQQLISVYIDSEVSPGTHEWHAWSQGTRGGTRSVTYAATSDPDTHNLREYTRTETLMAGNVIFSFSKFGWNEHDNDPTGLKIDATLGLGALPSFSEVDKWARAELAEDSENRVEHSAEILPVSDADKPYWAYGIGDRVTIGGSSQVCASIFWRRDRHRFIHWNQEPAA